MRRFFLAANRKSWPQRSLGKITVLGTAADKSFKIGFVVKERIGIGVYNPYSLAAILGCPQTAIIIQMKTETELNEGTEMQAVDLLGKQLSSVCQLRV
jgi:hypothetical protein